MLLRKNVNLIVKNSLNSLNMKILPWIYAARPKTLVASVIPVVSSVFILPEKHIFNFYIFILTIIAAVIIQIVTNYINDLYDFLKGADTNRLGPKRMVQSGLIQKHEIKKAIIILIIVGIICGIPLAIQGGWIIVAIGLSSFLFAYLYTSGPIPLAYNAMGDIFVFIYFGIIAVTGSFYLQTGYIDINALFLGSALGFQNMILLSVNNLRDYHNDKKVNKRTLVVIIGQKLSKIQTSIVIMLFYIAIYGLASNLDNMQILYFVLIGLPISANIIYDIWLKQQAELNSTLAKSSLFQIVNMLLLLLGIYI